uniref:Uncharacterized protein n=1 Tax=viral metagenome TaxID=1070528 RepID=A0A6C0I582_9ZZZZ
MFNIFDYCNKKKCMQKVEYNKLATGGNEPRMTKAMRYAQYVRNAKPKNPSFTDQQLIAKGILP